MSIQSLTDLLCPGGAPLGTPGSSPAIRIVPGTVAAAKDLFMELARGGTDITPPGHPGIVVQLPLGAIGFRPVSKSGPPTIDVNVPGIPIKEIKFV